MAERHHLVVPVAHWNDLAAQIATAPTTPAVHVAGGATPIVLAALADQLTTPVVLWLVLDDAYSAPLAARDVATLSWLVNVAAVVVSRPGGRAPENAHVVAALLGRDDVTLTATDVTVASAYNRPLPPHPIEVWAADGPPEADHVHLSLLRDEGDLYRIIDEATSHRVAWRP